MRRKVELLLVLVLSCVLTYGQKSPKYVFMFIGDGMGTNQVLATQMYLSELEGRTGIVPLCFTQFPVTGLSLTYSASSGVTDSAAGGTALSSGNKTANNVMGMLSDRSTSVKTIAERAHEQGHRVAVCTTVSVDHATPAAFYAHRPSRNDYHQIGMQLAESGFEFFAGSDFLQNFDKKNPDMDCGNYAYAEQKGYKIVRGYEEYRANRDKADKMILLQPERDDIANLRPRIDQHEGEFNLEQITEAAVDFMMKEPDKGFFMMVEGGLIDHCLHGNDAASAIQEVIDFDNAIKVAYDFYQKHKDETLIVVTADHETGGIVLGLEKYMLNLKVLKNQKMSEEAFTNYLQKKNAELEEGPLTWEEVQEELKSNFGFWDSVRISESQENRLRNAYVETFGMNYVEENQEEYYKVDKLSDLAVKILCEVAQINWGTGSHSAGYVPVFAVGNGASSFTGQIENTEIPVRIAEIAGYKW